jgi:glucokinase
MVQANAAAARGSSTGLIVGIDIGGTGTRFVAVEPATHRVLARVTQPTPADAGRDEVLAFLWRHIERVSGGRRPAAIGIGASGPVDRDGIIRNPDTLPAFSGWPVIGGLAHLTDGPVVIDNDAVCAALAEHFAGASRDAPRSLHVTLGTGIGVCLLDTDRPFRRSDGTHPEGGHITVAVPTTPCYCGRPACWEQAASRQVLQRTAAGQLGRAPSDPMAISELAERAGRGEAESLATFAAYGRAVAEGLGTLLALYGPDIVVLGGSGARNFALYRETIHTALAPLGRWTPTVNIVATTLDDYGGAIGAARLVTPAGAPAHPSSTPTSRPSGAPRERLARP